jgi:hypothetical protein
MGALQHMHQLPKRQIARWSMHLKKPVDFTARMTPQVHVKRVLKLFISEQGTIPSCEELLKEFRVHFASTLP